MFNSLPQEAGRLPELVIHLTICFPLQNHCYLGKFSPMGESWTCMIPLPRVPSLQPSWSFFSPTRALFLLHNLVSALGAHWETHCPPQTMTPEGFL